MINWKTVLLWTGVAETHTLLWTYSLLLPRYVPRMPELAPYKTSLKGLLTPGAAAVPPVCGSCMPCCGPNRGSYPPPTPGPCHQTSQKKTSPSISQLCEFSYFGLQSLVIIQNNSLRFLGRNKRRVHSRTRILQQSLENSRRKTQSMMTWSTQQQSILSHSDLIEQSPRGSGNVPSNPKLGFILHSSQYHRDPWRIGRRRSKNVTCKMQRPKKEFQIQQRAFLPPFLPPFLCLRRIAPRVISVSNLAKKRQQIRSAHTWGGTCCCHAIVVEVWAAGVLQVQFRSGACVLQPKFSKKKCARSYSPSASPGLWTGDDNNKRRKTERMVRRDESLR